VMKYIFCYHSTNKLKTCFVLQQKKVLQRLVNKSSKTNGSRAFQLQGCTHILSLRCWVKNYVNETLAVESDLRAPKD